jgi:hypothetical protein
MQLTLCCPLRRRPAALLSTCQEPNTEVIRSERYDKNNNACWGWYTRKTLPGEPPPGWVGGTLRPRPQGGDGPQKGVRRLPTPALPAP